MYVQWLRILLLTHPDYGGLRRSATRGSPARTIFPITIQTSATLQSNNVSCILVISQYSDRPDSAIVNVICYYMQSHDGQKSATISMSEWGYNGIMIDIVADSYPDPDAIWYAKAHCNME